ncbi:hypothetical protein R3P38DRAFT_895343 [Favolaschia claudopus]|uniref:Uncharacterized protein n=1 Tax=Favolaschia claudopus TaxID=2862362 RepID=A0AAW0BV66_9AGAR
MLFERNLLIGPCPADLGRCRRHASIASGRCYLFSVPPTSSPAKCPLKAELKRCRSSISAQYYCDFTSVSTEASPFPRPLPQAWLYRYHEPFFAIELHCDNDFHVSSTCFSSPTLRLGDSDSKTTQDKRRHVEPRSFRIAQKKRRLPASQDNNAWNVDVTRQDTDPPSPPVPSISWLPGKGARLICGWLVPQIVDSRAVGRLGVYIRV